MRRERAARALLPLGSPRPLAESANFGKLPNPVTEVVFPSRTFFVRSQMFVPMLSLPSVSLARVQVEQKEMTSAVTQACSSR